MAAGLWGRRREGGRTGLLGGTLKCPTVTAGCVGREIAGALLVLDELRLGNV